MALHHFIFTKILVACALLGAQALAPPALRTAPTARRRCPALAAGRDAPGDRPPTALAAGKDTGDRPRTALTSKNPLTTTFDAAAVDYDDSDYGREMKAARRQAAADRLDVIKRLNVIAYVNAGVIAFVALGVGYELLHVDAEAILALFQYSLPADNDGTGLAYRVATSFDLLARLPSESIQGYEALVKVHPVFYKACTSGVAYTLGDFVSQVYQGRTLKTVDLARSARSGAAGFVGHGPLCHYWMVFMETYLDFDGAWYGTGVKVLADQTVWSLYLNACYSFLIGTFALRDPREVWKDVKATSWPALRSSWRFWPFVHCISFSHLVPLDLKLLWVDAMEIVWVTILSKVANDDKESRLEERGLEEDAEVLEMVESFGVDPTLEIELTREFELDASLNADLANEGSFDEQKLSFELPKEALLAAWPLLAMWPVIYGTFQLEKLIMAG